MDKTYNIRMSFNYGNAITIDLKGCGQLYIKPGKDYYFINAPIEFTNYLAQLRRMGVTYKITNDRKGCYQTVDLTAYRVNDARSILSTIRKANVINEEAYLNEETKKEKEKGRKAVKKEDKKVVLSSDNITKVKEVIVDKPKNVDSGESKDEKVNNNIPNVPEINVPEAENTPVEAETPIVEDTNKSETTNESTEQPKVYSEEELNKMSKNKLLDVAKSYKIDSVSEINTKKEIREAILEIQK